MGYCYGGELIISSSTCLRYVWHKHVQEPQGEYSFGPPVCRDQTMEKERAKGRMEENKREGEAWDSERNELCG